LRGGGDHRTGGVWKKVLYHTRTVKFSEEIQAIGINRIIKLVFAASEVIFKDHKQEIFRVGLRE